MPTGKAGILLPIDFWKSARLQTARELILTDLLTSHRPALAKYGVTKAQVTDLETSVDDFRELVGHPRLKRTQANLAKKAVEELVESAVEVLNEKMDKVMLQFQFSNPSFYEGYKKARVIVD